MGRNESSAGLIDRLDGAVSGIRVAWRFLAKDVPFTTVTILTLALAIGANTAMFSVIDSVLRQPLPFRDPQRMVWITENTTNGATRLAMAIGGDLEQWQSRGKSFEALSVLLGTDAMLAGKEPTQVRVACVSASVARLFGVSPIVGRDFRDDEFDHAPAAPGLRPNDLNRKDTGIAILTERLFRKLGSDAALLGKPVTIAGTPYTIVGVLPANFRLPVAPSLQLGVGAQTDVDVMLNTTIGSSRVPGALLGRLARGVPLDTAVAELQGLRAAANQSRSENESTADLDLRVVGLHDYIVADSKRVLLILWGCVGFVLLVACINIIALMLSRSVARSQETAIRIALGASRWRILRQTLMENSLLAVAGGTLGLGLAYVVIRGLARAAGVDVPRLQDAALNGSVLLFSAGVCAMVALLLSAVPAMTPQLNVERQLRATTGSIASAAPVRRWHNALVVFELACALIPLTGAGLMLRSLSQVQSEGAIVKPQQVLLGRIQPGPQGSGGSDGDRLQESDRVLREIEATAGIRSAALWSATFGLPAKVAGLPTRDKPPVAMWFSVSPEFREAAGLQLVAGRWLSPADRRASVPVVVVSERFAREFAANVPSIPSLVGRATIGPFPPPNSSEREAPMTIVGIVSDFRSGRLGILQPDAVNPLPQVFYPDALRPMVGGELIVRVNDNPVAFIDPVRRAVQTRPGARLVAVRSLEDQLALATAPRRFNTRLFVAFAVLATLLAAIGVAGVFRHAVTQRTREIGLRLAVGATRLDVLRMVMSHAATLAILGVVVGAGGAAIVSRSLEHILYGVDAYDPRTYLTMSAALVAVALVAAYLPARRAMGLDPVMVLRHE